MSPAGLGWDGLNLISTIGAFIVAAGVLLFVIDLCRSFRPSGAGGQGNSWNTGTLEWLPSGLYQTRSIPIVTYWAGSGVLWIASSGLIAYASWSLRESDRFGQWPLRLALLASIALALVAIWIDVHAQWEAGLRPGEHSYGAIVSTLLSWQGFHVGLLVIMGLYTLARSLCGLIDGVRRQTFDNTMLMWHYTIAQGLVGLALIHLFPRLIG